jgi:hypothetical protein
MLLEIDVDFEKVQVLNSESEHPTVSLFPQMYCPCCGCNLHGHGWRQRYLVDGENHEYSIWIHRKRCPRCSTTYTLLPKWVHAFKCYTVVVIKAVLNALFDSGHLGNHLQVNRTLQRQWRAQYVRRASILGNCYGKKDLEQFLQSYPGSCITSPLKLQLLTHRMNGRMEARVYKPPGPHHHLFLFVPCGVL